MAFNGVNPRTLLGVRLADLVPGVEYQLPGPITVPRDRIIHNIEFEQGNINRLVANPHVFLERSDYRIEFKGIPEDGKGIKFVSFYIRSLPDGENALFLTRRPFRNIFTNNIKKKALNQTVRNTYERMTNQNSTPVTGPANKIRGFLGVQPPKGSERKRKTRKTRNRKSRKSRK